MLGRNDELNGSLVSVRIVQGADAFAMLDSDTVRRQWASLVEDCPWATSCQTHGFAASWYTAYAEHFEPLLVLSEDRHGELQGILALAKARSDPRIVPVGANQGEYKVWVCHPDLGSQFPAAAISALRNLLPPSGLTLRYLPANAPLEWLAESGLENLCILRHRRRPLLRFADGGKIEHLLRKSQNKIRFNRLKKLGRVELVRFTSRNEIEAHFDQISEAYDLRRTAVNGLPVFRRDCLKKPFYLALMDQPGVLHATALKVGDQIVSMHFNGIAKKGVFLGLTAYDPLYGQNSPGKLHILLLAQMLKAEGFEQLDLTPGGDPFKEDFADASDDVSTLAVYPTVNARRLAVLRYAGEDVARTLLHRVSITPTTAGVQAKDLLQLGIGATFKTAARRSADWIASRQETKIYASDGAALPMVAANMTIRRNNLVDLLDCRLPSDELSRRPFVADALARIQQGQHLFTCIESGRLLCMAWLVEKVTKSIAEKLLPVIVPSDVPLAHDFFIAPTATGSDAAELLLRAMLQHAAGPAGDQQVLVAVPAHTALADYCAGAPALKYRGTVFRSRRLGRQRQWADTSPALGCSERDRLWPHA